MLTQRVGRYTSAAVAGRARLEVEVKIPVASPRQARRRLTVAGARRLARARERNWLFDWPDRRLSRAGRLLRLREQNGTAWLTFKAPAAGTRYKRRREIETEVTSVAATRQLLAALGLRVWFRYEKVRTRYQLPGLGRLVVELDETPIGTFFELEGPPKQIDQAARRLGYGTQDYLTATYYELFQRYRQAHRFSARDMVFVNRSSRRRGAS